MPYTNYTSKEVTSRGEAIYRQEIRHKVNPKHKGKFLVIDIETGEYEMNADDLVATKRLLAKSNWATTRVAPTEADPM